MRQIGYSVGDWSKGAKNISRDVASIQRSLTMLSKLTQKAQFDPKGVDGKIARPPIASSTVSAIRAFQSTFLSKPDSLIEPSKLTLRKLQEKLASLPAPSIISPPLNAMKIRWDGINPAAGGMRTLDSPRFGMTRNKGTKAHSGVDLQAGIGTPIYAIADGMIEDVRSTHLAYGVDILLRFRPVAASIKYLAMLGNIDQDGILFAHYGHLSDTFVKEGQLVKRGTLLGSTGVSGNADLKYPHLHFEIRKKRWPGIGALGLQKRINPESVFLVDFIEPFETLAEVARTA